MSSSSAIRAGAAYVELSLRDGAAMKGLASWQKRMSAWGASVTSFGKKLFGVGAAAVGGFGAITKLGADVGSELVDMSTRTGASVEALSELSYAAKTGGTDLSTLEGALGKMQTKLGQAENGADSAADSFRDIGVSISDLKGLSPDEQFSKVAKAISGISNQEKKVAAIRDIFGKSGTALLPMIDNLEEARAKARELGLQVSGADANAVEAFGDKIDTLWLAIKTTALTISSALVPEAGNLADKAIEIVGIVANWIKSHRELIVMAAKVAIGIAAVGGVILAFGYALTAAGAILGGVISAAGVFGTVIGVAGSVLAFLLSPLGLVIAGVTALAAYFLSTTNIIGSSVDWLKQVFGILKNDTLAAFAGMKEAIGAGDWALAAKILWATLKLEFQRGINYLSGLWEDFKSFFQTVWSNAVYSCASIFVDSWAGLQNAWSETVGFLGDAWTIFTSFLTKSWSTAIGFIKKAWVGLKSLFDKDINVSAEFERINSETESNNTATDDAQNKAISDAEKIRNDRRKSIESDRTGSQKALADAKAAEDRKRAEAQAKQLAADEKEIADSRADMAKLLEDAHNEAVSGETPELNINKDKLANGGKIAEDIATQKKTSLQGTFSAAAASRFDGGSREFFREIAVNTKKTAAASQETAENTAKPPGLPAGNN